MLPRFSVCYIKVIVYVLLLVCFVKMLLVEYSNDEKHIMPIMPPERVQQHEKLQLLIENWQSSQNKLQNLKFFQAANNSKQEPTPNYELLIRQDLAKQAPGLGDNGKAVELVGKAKQRGDRSYQLIALNEELSELLPYTRPLADARHPECLQQHFDRESLPTASVIIVFFNEPYSTLVRTLHSVLNTCTPARVLQQIILVDDGSTNAQLAGKLDYYIQMYIRNDKVRIVRLQQRLGLIRARLAGARNATGDVLIFLDAHCEANIGWCEPLLQRIKSCRTCVLLPLIDVIDANTFEYISYGYHNIQVGGFTWNGNYAWISVPQREKKRQLRDCQEHQEICPTRSATMPGGLFAMDRHYFWKLGSYDEQMNGWGGENLEMSFRIWQCGGSIETLPCSRVGHVFREFLPYNLPNVRDTHGINTARLALVWMDDYAKWFFLYRPDLKFDPSIGVISERVALRQRLQCKSFDWYLRNIYPEKFVFANNVIAYGRVRALSKNLCLDSLMQENSDDSNQYTLSVFTCSKKLTASQLLSYTNSLVLRNELFCADISKQENAPFNVLMRRCEPIEELNPKWKYRNQQLIHVSSNLCLDCRGLRNMDSPVLVKCEGNSLTQRWVIAHD